MRECLKFCGSGQDIRASLDYEFSGILLVYSPVMHCLLEVHGPLYLIADLAAFEKNYPLSFFDLQSLCGINVILTLLQVNIMTLLYVGIITKNPCTHGWTAFVVFLCIFQKNLKVMSSRPKVCKKIPNI